MVWNQEYCIISQNVQIHIIQTIRAAMGAICSDYIPNTDLRIFKNTHKIIAADLRGKNASTYEFPNKCVLV